MSLRKSLLAHVFPRFSQRFFDFAYALPLPGMTFFNLGVTPVPESVAADPQGRREPYQAALYDLVLGQLPEVGAEDLIVEVSSGKGAGAAYLRRHCPARLHAFEPAWTGRMWSMLLFGLRARYALAEALPVEDGTAAALISVESAHNYMTEAFAAEAWRLLRPGGRLIIADFPLMRPENQARKIPAWLEKGGFVIESFTDLTPRVIAACEADDARKRRIFRFLPKPLREEAQTSFSCDPSPRLNSFRTGERGYYFVVATKPATAGAT
ncbi:class I SAM-dependent methyltransferase [Rhodovulum sp. P5]|uniref:class I SAM-dependent methyltransferase n=1 Tax=Rhodovulum sp. P5 TaxID=1564506 RepID=UPI001561096D|nr:methyltransferase domain-containing protein [Rhodovulum sp. P5]